MQKLDRLGWAAGLSFEAFGLRIGLRALGPSALERLKAGIPLGWSQAGNDVAEWIRFLRLST